MEKRDTWYKAFVWQYNEAGPRKPRGNRATKRATKKRSLLKMKTNWAAVAIAQEAQQTKEEIVLRSANFAVCFFESKKKCGGEEIDESVN